MPIRSLPRIAKGLPVLLLAGMAAGQTVPPVVVPPGTGTVAGAVVKAVGGVAAQAVQSVGKALTPSADQVGKLVEKALAPRISEFTLDGFKVTGVVGADGALPAAFSGKGHLALPAPLGDLEVTFANLVVTGAQAAGTLTGTFPAGRTADHQGWRWAPTGVKISDKGSHLLGSITSGRLKVVVDTAAFTPSGLTGSLALGDVPLAEGPFSASLQGAELVFSAEPPVLKGALKVAMDAGYRNGDTGVPVEASCPVAFDPALLGGTGDLAGALAADLPVEAQGLVFRMEKLALVFERGVPILKGPARLAFPLQTFCLAASTGQPYVSQPSSAALRGTAPTGEITRPGAGTALATGLQARTVAAPKPALALRADPRGFSGAFPLPAAMLLPSGLSTYHLKLESGKAVVKEGLLDPEATTVTGSLTWGPGWTAQADFKDAPAALADGFYTTRGHLKGEVPVGAFGVQAPLSPLVCDFSSSLSPKGLPAAWQGVHLQAYLLALPEELYRFDKDWNRMTVFASAKGGAFEANGGFSGKVAVSLPGLVNLHVVPVKLEPFELEFGEGVLLDLPRVKGIMELDQPPVLPDFNLPVAFDLTLNGPRRILLDTRTPSGDLSLKTDLVGVDIVLASATLNPTNLDLAGRFDFHLKGANLPSVPFDHMVMEATGGGLEGKKGPLAFGMVGSLWSNLQGHSKIRLWGYGFGLQEDGYGTLADGRFFVGFGGEMDINPVLNSVYNRVLFTTVKDDVEKGTVEIERGFDINQSMAGLGSVKGSLDFMVDTAGDDVSDAYFLGTGKVNLEVGDAPINIDAGLRFGQSFLKPEAFPYFYLLGHVVFPESGIQVAPDVEVYGLAGGIAQNFLPEEIRNTTEIKGRADDTLGLAIMAGVDVGTTDNYTFHGDLDLYISQNLTTRIQGEGFFMASRDESPSDRTVTADLLFTRNPNAFHAVIDADLTFYNGLLRFMGTVEMKFDPTSRFVHIGTSASPLVATYMGGMGTGTGYFDADFAGGKSAFTTGGGFSMDSGNRDFGIVWGRAYLNVWGELVVIIDADLNPAIAGVLNAQGGASFGMKFETFWHTYRVTIFSGDIAANMAFRAPGSPALAGHVDVSYSVLGGLFSGSAGVDMEF